MTISRRRILIGIAGLGLLAALPAHGKDMARLSGRAFGTGWSVLLPGGADAAIADALVQRLADIDRGMSPFRPDSEITRFNGAAAGAMPVGPDVATVVREALAIARLSGGAFDPTVGPLVGRYGFGPMRGARIGDFTGLALEGTDLVKSRAGLSLDLCGIAKGYALDALADLLRAAGHTDYLIDIGGELLAAGHGPQGGPWHLGIADPLRGGVHSTIAASGLALATSGDAINAYEVGGRRYSHTIDPHSGEPVVSDIASASVVHASAMSADGLATAMIVLGVERGLDLANAMNLPVLYLRRDGAGGVVPAMSDAYRDYAAG